MDAHLGSNEAFDLIKWVAINDPKNLTPATLQHALHPDSSNASVIKLNPKTIQGMLEYIRTESNAQRANISPQTAAKLQKLCQQVAQAKIVKTAFIGRIKDFFDNKKIAQIFAKTTQDLNQIALENPGGSKKELEAAAKSINSRLEMASRSEKNALFTNLAKPNGFLEKALSLHEEPLPETKESYRMLVRTAYKSGNLAQCVKDPMPGWAKSTLKQALREEMHEALHPRFTRKVTLSELTQALPTLKIEAQKEAGSKKLIPYLANAAADVIAEEFGRPRSFKERTDELQSRTLGSLVQKSIEHRLQSIENKAVVIVLGQSAEADPNELKAKLGVPEIYPLGNVRSYFTKMLSFCDREQVQIDRIENKKRAASAPPRLETTAPKEASEGKESTSSDVKKSDSVVLAARTEALLKKAQPFLAIESAILHFPHLVAMYSSIQNSTERNKELLDDFERVLGQEIIKLQRDQSLCEFISDEFEQIIIAKKVPVEDVMPEILLEIVKAKIGEEWQVCKSVLTHIVSQTSSQQQEVLMQESMQLIKKQMAKLK